MHGVVSEMRSEKEALEDSSNLPRPHRCHINAQGWSVSARRTEQLKLWLESMAGLWAWASMFRAEPSVTPALQSARMPRLTCQHTKRDAGETDGKNLGGWGESSVERR